MESCKIPQKKQTRNYAESRIEKQAESLVIPSHLARSVPYSTKLCVTEHISFLGTTLPATMRLMLQLNLPVWSIASQTQLKVSPISYYWFKVEGVGVQRLWGGRLWVAVASGPPSKKLWQPPQAKTRSIIEIASSLIQWANITWVTSLHANWTNARHN